MQLYNSPLTFWKRRLKDRPARYKISPMDMSRRDSEAVLENYNGEESTNIHDVISENSVIKVSTSYQTLAGSFPKFIGFFVITVCTRRLIVII